MLKMTTIEDAKALGLQDQIGTLEKGKRADIIALDLSHSSFHPFYNPISNIVYTALGNEVSFFMCEGKVLMEDYKIKSLDEKEILNKIQLFAQKSKKISYQ